MRVFTILVLLSSLAVFLHGKETAAMSPEKEWRKAVTQLGSNNYKERIAAQKALIAASEKHTAALLKLAGESWKASEDPEVRFRLYEVMEQVVRAHIYDHPSGYLGITMIAGESLHERKTIGVIRAYEVKDDSPAAKAGLVPDDEIFEIEGKRFDKDVRTTALRHFLQTKRPGDEIELGILRDFKPKTIKVKLGLSPNFRKQVEKDNFHQFFTKWWATNVGK